MSELRSLLVRLAHEEPLLRRHLVPLLRRFAMEHPTEDARKKYLKEHPKANPKRHTVSEGKGSGKGKSNGKPLKDRVGDLMKQKQKKYVKLFNKSKSLQTKIPGATSISAESTSRFNPDPKGPRKQEGFKVKIKLDQRPKDWKGTVDKAYDALGGMVGRDGDMYLPDAYWPTPNTLQITVYPGNPKAWEQAAP